MFRALFSLAICVFLLHYASAQSHGFAFKHHPAKKQMDIVYSNKLISSYCYSDSLFKPILNPVNTPDGITVTRGFPLHPKAGERTDHPHQQGIWFNYESINGIDFWNSSTSIPFMQRHRYGTISHQQIIQKKAGRREAYFTTTSIWQTHNGQALLHEKSTYIFSIKKRILHIERKIEVIADTLVVFKDAKDGLFAIRVARPLEVPAKDATGFIKPDGTITTPKIDTAGVTGRYTASNGSLNDSVFGSTGQWVKLDGNMQNMPVTIAIMDHPANANYPGYWFTRGYGLFAINPLGRSVFSKASIPLNYTLQKHQSARYRYLMVIHSGSLLTAKTLDRLAAKFQHK